MLDFPRWKIASIIGALLFGILLAVPSLMPESTARQMGLGFAPRINLGLDLAGGSHILLEADTADVAKSRLAAMEDTIRAEMRRIAPQPIDIGDISTANGSLSFFVRDPAQVDAAVREDPHADRAGRLDRHARLGRPRGRFDPHRHDPDQGRHRPVRQSGDGGCDRHRPQAHRRARHQGADDRRARAATASSSRCPASAIRAQLKALIGKTAKLEFKLVDTQADPAKVAAGQAPVGDQILHYENGGADRGRAARRS